MEIELDGVEITRVDTVSNDHLIGKLLFTNDDLDNGYHTVRIMSVDLTIRLNGIMYLDNFGNGFAPFVDQCFTTRKGEDVPVVVQRQ